MFSYSFYSTQQNQSTSLPATSLSKKGVEYKCLNCGEITSFKPKDIIRCKPCGKLLFIKCRDPSKSSHYVSI